jgi:hypothetical protein
MEPPGSVVAIGDQDEPIVHINEGFGKRKRERQRYKPPTCHQPL